MFGDDPEMDKSHRRVVRRKAEARHGGSIAGPWRLIQNVKVLLQRNQIGHLTQISKGPANMVTLKLEGEAVIKALRSSEAFATFVEELKETAENCGYILLYGDDFVQMDPCDE